MLSKAFSKVGILFFSFMILGANLPCSASERVLEPFTTDGCSGFPDGTYGKPDAWLHCCVEHDVAYWAGGPAEEKLKADLKLYECVKATGHPWIADAMYYGVRVGGRGNLSTTYRWAYGWTPPREYEPLSDEEKAWVARMTPKSLAGIPIQVPKHYRVPYPTETGDYCVDAVLRDLRKRLGDVRILKTEPTYRKNGLGTTYKITTDQCNGELEYYFPMSDRVHCQGPYYQTEAPELYFNLIDATGSCKDGSADALDHAGG